MMGEAELRELADDIAKHGLETRIDLYHDMKADKFSLVDGRNRLDALEMTGAKIFDDKGKVQERFVGKILTSLGGNRDIVAYVVSKNIRRRHLSLEQRRELLVKLINDDPKKSDRQLAKATGQSRNTISAQRKRLESTGSIEPVEKRKGADGKERKVRHDRQAARAKCLETKADRATAEEAPGLVEQADSSGNSEVHLDSFSGRRKRATEKVARSLNGSAPTLKVAEKPTAPNKSEASAKALVEFKFACQHWLPKMTPEHRSEAVKFVAGLVSP